MTLPPINAGGPLSNVPQFQDPNRIVPDPDFTGRGALWTFDPSSMWSLSDGALAGGSAVLTANSAVGRPFIEPLKLIQGYADNRTPWRDRAGPANVTVRWLRTNSLYDANSATTNPFVSVEWTGSDGASATKIFFDGSVNSTDRWYPNNFAANSWHTLVFSGSPAPGTVQAGPPRLSFYITSGTIKLDQFDARQL